MLTQKAVTTYKDCWDRPTELTDEELAWFNKTVEKARCATGCRVPIIPYDHELYDGKSRDALGCCFTLNPKNPLAENADSYITIDCYFINEAYRSVFFGDFLISGQNLEEVIAHEIAHLTVWRHGKKHTALTAQILDQIRSAA